MSAAFRLCCAVLIITCLSANRVHALEGTVVFTTKEGAVILKDMDSGDTTWLAPGGTHPRACFSPDGREVAVRMGNGSIRVIKVDGTGYRDLVTDELTVTANPWLYWTPSGHIYWTGGHGGEWHSWLGPHDRVYRVDAATGAVDTVYRDSALSSTMSLTRDGDVGYRHRRWDLTSTDTMVHYIGNCGAAMSGSGALIAATKPYHRSVHFYSRDTLEACCPTTEYTRCWGGGCVADTFGCAGDCQRAAFIDTVALPPEVWEERWATPEHAGDAWLVALKGFGGSEGAFLFNRETGEYWHFEAADFGTEVITPGDFWPGPLPDLSSPAIRLTPTSLVFAGSGVDTVLATNAGGGSLGAVDVSWDAAWLTVTALGGTDTQQIETVVDAASLQPGLYSDTVAVFGGGAADTSIYTVTLSVGGALLAPSDLAAVSGGTGEPISLTWTDNTTDEDGFALERTDGGGTSVSAGTVGPDVDSFSDASLSESGIYTYRVRAYRGSDTSAWSNEAAASFVSATDIVITSPTQGDTLQGGSSVTITWTAGNTVGSIGIEVSYNGGEDYLSVVDSGSAPPEDGSYSFTVRDTSSSDVFIKLYEYEDPQGAQAQVGPVVVVKQASIFTLSDPACAHQVRLRVGATHTSIDIPTGGAFTVVLHTLDGRLVATRHVPAADAFRVRSIDFGGIECAGVLLVRVFSEGLIRTSRVSPSLSPPGR